MGKEVKKVELVGDEVAQYQAWKKMQAANQAVAKKKEDMEAYRKLVNSELEIQVPRLIALSKELKFTKAAVLKGFQDLVEMKMDVLERKDKNQRSHTFTHTDGSKRITIGSYVNDNYLDTVEDGIGMVHEYLESLAVDAKTKGLVSMVLKLLAKDSTGNLKASRVLQLRKLSEESGDARFQEGVHLIEDAYAPAVSKQYVQVATKEKGDAWKNVPLGLTEA